MKTRRFSLRVEQQEFPGGGNLGTWVWTDRGSVDLPDNITRSLLMDIIERVSPHDVRMSYTKSDFYDHGWDVSMLFSQCRGGGRMQRAWDELPDA